MVILKSNLYDSSPSTTNQRPHDEVYETPRFSPPDAYRYCHARVAASRCLRENDGNGPLVSDIQDLSLLTAFDGKLAIGNAVERRIAAVSKRSWPLGPPALLVPIGRPRLASAHRFDFEGSGIPPPFRRISQSIFPQRGSDASFHPRDTVKAVGV